jgi:chromosome segregation ATPase
VDKIDTQSIYPLGLEDDRRKYQEEISQLEGKIKRLNSDKSVAEYELDCLESAKLLLCIKIETLKQQKAAIEEQPIRLFSAPNLDNEMTLSNNPDIILSSSGMGYKGYR